MEVSHRRCRGGPQWKKLYDDDVLVIGLGRFGSAVALELQRLGHHVVAVERDHASPRRSSAR